MKKVIQINENQLESLINTVIEEDIKDDLKKLKFGNIAKGIKGMYRGKGYEFYSYQNEILKIVKEIKKLDLPNQKQFKKLKLLQDKISNSGMELTKKQELNAMINDAETKFVDYQDIINDIETKIIAELK